MNRTLIVGLLCAAGFLANLRAEDAKPAPKPETAEHAKRELTPEQKKLRKEILAKYDANKDGKLDKEERKAISAEDLGRLDKAGLGRKHKKKAE